MRLLLLTLTSLVISLSAFCQDINVLIAEADKIETVPNEKAAFEQFKIIHKRYPNNLYALVKCSELSSRIGTREKETKARDAYYNAAVFYGKQALTLNPNSDEAHVSYAIAMGRISLLKSGKDKLSIAKEVKHHADIALKLNPNNFKAWHIVGKWNYEVSNLSFLERTGAKLFYGGIPSATLQSAIAAYEKARALNSGFLLNHLELAKAYKRNDEDKKAIACLKQILLLPVKTEDDPRIKKDAVRLLKEWD